MWLNINFRMIVTRYLMTCWYSRVLIILFVTCSYSSALSLMKCCGVFCLSCLLKLIQPSQPCRISWTDWSRIRWCHSCRTVTSTFRWLFVLLIRRLDQSDILRASVILLSAGVSWDVSTIYRGMFQDEAHSSGWSSESEQPMSEICSKGPQEDLQHSVSAPYTVHPVSCEHYGKYTVLVCGSDRRTLLSNNITWNSL